MCILFLSLVLVCYFSELLLVMGGEGVDVGGTGQNFTYIFSIWMTTSTFLSYRLRRLRNTFLRHL